MITAPKNDENHGESKSCAPRCSWAMTHADKPFYVDYHDTEWGVPVHDDRLFFEMLILEGAQAGLSWLTILARRDTYRAAFDNFDVHKVAAYDDAKQQALLADPGIIRNKLKIAATIQNAKTFIAIQNEFGSFDAYIWQFVENKPVFNHWKTMGDVPVSTELSDRISKDLKKRGMKFVGTTIIYSFLQATGLVMDHTVECYRYPDLVK